VKAAESNLGWEARKQPDWFRDKGSQLKAIIGQRNEFFRKWLRSGRSDDRQRYVVKRREANMTVKKAKNEWMQEKTRKVEAGLLMGNSLGSMWKSLKELQRGKFGLRSVKTRTIRKAKCDPCKVSDVLGRWQEHFSQVLNVTSSYVVQAEASVPSCRVRTELDVPPS